MPTIRLGQRYLDVETTEGYAECGTCGDLVPNGDCNDCRWFDNPPVFCVGCNTQTPAEQPVCNRCMGSSRGNGWDYNEFPHPHSGTRFGVELETHQSPGYFRFHGNTFWGCKTDGSTQGMEFISPPMSGEAGLDSVEEMCAKMNEYGWTVNRSCGTHVHIDVSELDFAQIRHLWLCYKRTEQQWRNLVDEQRRSNGYCRQMLGDPYVIANCENETEFNREARVGYERYCWVNFTAIQRHGTIENRLLEGTIDATRLRWWINANIMFRDRMLTENLDRVEEVFNEIFAEVGQCVGSV